MESARGARSMRAAYQNVVRRFYELPAQVAFDRLFDENYTVRFRQAGE